MALPLVFNELSVEPRAREISELKMRFDLLLRALRVAVRAGAERGLRVSQDFFQTDFGCGYNLQSIFRLYAPEEAEFLRDFFSSLSFVDLNENCFCDRDVVVNERSSLGLRFAHSTGGIAVSFLSEDFWNRSTITALERYLDDEGGIETVEINLKHVARDVHVNDHHDYISIRSARNRGLTP